MEGKNMSLESVGEFLEMLSQSEELQPSFRSSIADGADEADAVVAFAGERGHSFTADEYREVAELIAGAEDELAESELEAVSGGFNPQPDPPRDFNQIKLGGGSYYKVPTWMRGKKTFR
jgi:predicted ribosomally synthesized peptide with nif11-like leader